MLFGLFRLSGRRRRIGPLLSQSPRNALPSLFHISGSCRALVQRCGAFPRRSRRRCEYFLQAASAPLSSPALPISSQADVHGAERFEGARNKSGSVISRQVCFCACVRGCRAPARRGGLPAGRRLSFSLSGVWKEKPRARNSSIGLVSCPVCRKKLGHVSPRFPSTLCVCAAPAFPPYPAPLFSAVVL